jgi:hypothetical protein
MNGTDLKVKNLILMMMIVMMMMLMINIIIPRMLKTSSERCGQILDYKHAYSKERS